jgi:hypothetical protein
MEFCFNKSSLGPFAIRIFILGDQIFLGENYHLFCAALYLLLSVRVTLNIIAAQMATPVIRVLAWM